MDAIYLLIPITVILLVVAVIIFFWAVNSDQYSDLDKEANRILFDKESTIQYGDVKDTPAEDIKEESSDR